MSIWVDYWKFNFCGTMGGLLGLASNISLLWRRWKNLTAAERSFYGRLGSYLDHAYQTDQQSSWVIVLGISAEVWSWDGHFLICSHIPHMLIKSIPCHFLLDAIASPSTYPCQWVSQSVSGSVIHSFRFGDSYRIFELCELHKFSWIKKPVQDFALLQLGCGGCGVRIANPLS